MIETTPALPPLPKKNILFVFIPPLSRDAFFPLRQYCSSVQYVYLLPWIPFLIIIICPFITGPKGQMTGLRLDRIAQLVFNDCFLALRHTLFSPFKLPGGPSGERLFFSFARWQYWNCRSKSLAEQKNAYKERDKGRGNNCRAFVEVFLLICEWVSEPSKTYTYILSPLRHKRGKDQLS